MAIQKGDLASVNTEAARRLIDGNTDGTVWTITISIGVVGHRAMETMAGGAPVGNLAGQHRRCSHYEMACERLVEYAGDCTKDAKVRGRNIVVWSETGEKATYQTV